MPNSKSRERGVRDYAAEYDRRVSRALERGQSRSQARGHPKAGEAPISAKRPPRPIPDEQLQRALRVLRQEGNLKEAAKAAHVSPEKLKHAAASKGAITKDGRRWIVNPKLPRRMLTYSRRKALAIVVGDSASASLGGSFMSAVAKFVGHPDQKLLQPFVGKGVTDIKGKWHPFETDPNWLYRLDSANGETFEQIYRVVV